MANLSIQRGRHREHLASSQLSGSTVSSGGCSRCGGQPGHPKARGARPWATPLGGAAPVRVDRLGVSSDDPVGPAAHRDPALGVRPEGEARDSERRGLVLDAARVGQHAARIGHEPHEVQIGQGSREAEIGHVRHRGKEALQAAAGAWVHREHDGMLRLDARDRLKDGAERALRIDIAGAVQGEQALARGVDDEYLARSSATMTAIFIASLRASGRRGTGPRGAG